MTNLTIKNVPEELHKALKLKAESHRRSLNNEIITGLEEYLYQDRYDSDIIKRRAAEIREKCGVYMTDKELKKMKSQGRP